MLVFIVIICLTGNVSKAALQLHQLLNIPYSNATSVSHFITCVEQQTISCTMKRKTVPVTDLMTAQF